MSEEFGCVNCHESFQVPEGQEGIGFTAFLCPKCRGSEQAQAKAAGSLALAARLFGVDTPRSQPAGTMAFTRKEVLERMQSEQAHNDGILARFYREMADALGNALPKTPAGFASTYMLTLLNWFVGAKVPQVLQQAFYWNTNKWVHALIGEEDSDYLLQVYNEIDIHAVGISWPKPPRP